VHDKLGAFISLREERESLGYFGLLFVVIFDILYCFYYFRLACDGPFGTASTVGFSIFFLYFVCANCIMRMQE